MKKYITYIELFTMIAENRQPKTIYIVNKNNEPREYTWSKLLDSNYDYTFVGSDGYRHTGVTLPSLSRNAVAVYTPIYYETDILDKVEKKYLHSLIKPFIDDVEYIVKVPVVPVNGSIYSIRIVMNNFAFSLPPFDGDAMYRGMKEYTKYSVEDLFEEEEDI